MGTIQIYTLYFIYAKPPAKTIALITDPAQRAADLSASANIRHEIPVLTLTDATQMTTAGYWYDAVTQLVQTKSPQLQELLQQEGIDIADK